MSTATYTDPNFTSQGGTQYKTNIDGAFSVLKRLAAAFAPHQKSTPDMTVAVDAGVVPTIAGVPTEVAAQNTATITAPSVDPRKDIVYIDALTGTVGVATGTEGASPADPSLPEGKVPIARINLTTSMTEITNVDLDDLRFSSLTRQIMDIPFNAGYGGDFTGEDLGVQGYGKIIVARPMIIEGEEGYIETAGTGAAVIVDIEKNGTSVYSTRPQFAISSNSLTAGTLTTTTLAAGDRLEFKVDQVGSTVKGQKLLFTLKARLA